jgi:D-arginine dehydrogenase
MERRFEFLVVGGGMAGVSAGAELARDGRVAVLEQEEQLGFHSTGRSAAIYMETYGNGPVRALTSGSRAFFLAPPQGFSEEPLVSRRGALFLAEEGQLAELGRHHEAVRKLAAVELLPQADLARLVPCLAPGRWAAGLYEPGAVDLDVHEILQGYARALRARGGEILTSARLEGLRRVGGLWLAATAAGELSAPVLVDAAGAWADVVGRLAGARPIGLEPRRRTALTIDVELPVADWPFVSDYKVEEVYFKPDARRLLVSPCDHTPTEPGHAVAEDYEVALAVDGLERATTLRVSHVPHRWAGLRSFVADESPVVGPDPEVEGLVWLAGQGGYGIQTAPALARLCRALTLGQGVPEDLARLGLRLEDVAPGRPALRP